MPTRTVATMAIYFTYLLLEISTNTANTEMCPEKKRSLVTKTVRAKTTCLSGAQAAKDKHTRCALK